MATKSKFSLLQYKNRLADQIADIDHRTLALWAMDCAQRAMPYFEENRPEDRRPRKALSALEAWIKTGAFEMAVIRAASLSAHAAARDVGEESPARSAARAAGQAVATAHVPMHAISGAIYALQAVHRATTPQDADDAVEAEYSWQLERLRRLARAAH
ncbi:MAG: hypothetical protein DWG76_04345 [Chloroflexi bacterium]|nr:hypothetical protein [Chloroflexota bacterium]MQC26667.1 hypothetical protein [Chloroflexota bacterium]